MSPTWESGHPTEDEWWRDLYGDPPRSARDIPPPRPGPAPPGPAPLSLRKAPVPPQAPPPVPPQAPPPVPPQPPRAWSAPDDALGRHFAGVSRATGDPDPARPYAPARPPEPPPDVPPPALPDGWAQVATAHAPAPPPPTAQRWPAADPERLADLVPDTVLEGARYGRLTVRALSARGDDARLHGRERREALLTARFGEREDTLLLLALAVADEGHARGAAVLRALGEALGAHRTALLADLRSRDEPALRAGLRRITERVRTADTRCPLSAVLLPAGPVPAARVYFGAGTAAPLRLRGGAWRPAAASPAPDRAFRLSLDEAEPGDVTLMSGGTVGALLDTAPRISARLAARWAPPAAPPAPAAFLADLATPVPGFGGDRTAIAVWDAPDPA